MTRPYLALLAVALVTALALSALGRRPHHASAHLAHAAEAPLVTMSVEIGPRGVSPEQLSAPKDHRVRLTITHRSGPAVSVRLAGYQDRVSIEALAAGETRVVEFLADRPGEDFTWLIDGRPTGRFTVTGSHLVGDHR